ncbi:MULTISPECIES: hypothetical protein [Sphingomonas]|uniref:DUF5983 domain-containing protein n=1 Tax=Sphingomonas turrisvirgatae TaxID=1888892 RepID=A0A1E3LRL4_9SPHN|nr:hypothetical protein [Sphingomonas turrisvirgatae]ODP36399.1 hypothetical protein BFL28_06695 [Sphingomonas turrisvirgatae]
MQVGHYVVLGTMHVRCATAEQLSEWAGWPAVDQPLAVSITPCGWFLPTRVPGRGDPLPAELHAILAFGRRHGCAYVLLDCDGPQSSALPVFPW